MSEIWLYDVLLYSFMNGIERQSEAKLQILEEADRSEPGRLESICSKSLEKFWSKRLEGFLVQGSDSISTSPCLSKWVVDACTRTFSQSSSCTAREARLEKAAMSKARPKVRAEATMPQPSTPVV